MMISVWTNPTAIFILIGARTTEQSQVKHELSVDSPILLFADDAKIFRSIRCEADYLQLQRDIDILFEWSRTWLLNFNISKCYVLHLGLTGGDYSTERNGTERNGMMD